MDLNFSTSDFPGIVNPVIYRAYESTNPTVLVADSGNIPAPHNAPANITIPGVNPLPHIVRCYELPPGAGLGILKKSFWIDPTFQSYNGEEVKFYVVDGGLTNDPTSGTKQIVDTYLDNKRYTVEIRDEGTLIFEEGINVRDEYTQLAGGGFEISEAGYAFQPNQVICVRIQARVSSAIPIATSVSIFQDVLTLDADTNLGSVSPIVLWKKKLLNISSTTNRIVIDLDFVGTVPNNVVIPFTSQSGNHINAVIRCQAGEKIIWNRGLYSELYLGMNEELWLTVHNGFYYVIKGSPRMSLVGTRIQSLSLGIPNTIFPQGDLKERLDYPALWKFINDNPLLLIAEANWADTHTINGIVSFKNKGFFTLGTTSTNFRLPDWRNRFFRTVKHVTADGTRITQGVGGMQWGENLEHQHLLLNPVSNASNAVPTNINYVNVQNESGAAGGFRYTMSGSAAIPTIGLSGKTGTEARPENLSEYSLLII